LDDYSFEEYMRDFNKVYSTEEISFRKSLFQSRVTLIKEHNSNPAHTWKMGVNKFADMTLDEQKSFRGFASRMPHLENSLSSPQRAGAIPDSVDWRTKGIVTPVKDQGSCGSCWAFSTTESVESYTCLNTGSLLTLSPQNVVSCTPNPNQCGGTGGCGGATMELGFTYVANNGIALDKDYPYTATNGKCDETIPKAAKVTGYIKTIENNYTDVIYALASGPLSVTVDASTWSLYSSGIFNGCSFKNIDLDHGVQAVGYGTESGSDYWIVRNSWGVTWGEKGYIRLLRHSDGDTTKWCGPDTNPQDGSGCKGGPSTITACGTCGIWYDTSYPTGAKLVN